MSETTGRRAMVETVHEAYSFACLSCGYTWEQGYDIEHHVARDGHTVYEYIANGVRVPSPLKLSSCPGCGHQRVRIMREGRTASAESPWGNAPGFANTAEPAEPVELAAPPKGEERRRWSRFFSRRAA